MRLGILTLHARAPSYACIRASLLEKGLCQQRQICLSRSGVEGVQLTVERAGDVALKGPTDLAVAMAFLRTFGDVVACSGVMNHPGHRNGVQGSVEAPIATPVEPMPDSVTA